MARKHGHEVARGNGYILERPTREGDVRYQARWREGRSWRSKTFGALDEAEDYLRKVGRAKRSGRYTPESRLTVAEVLAEYMDRGKLRWKSNTWSTYGTVIRFHIEPYIGKVRIVELTPWRVQQKVVMADFDDRNRPGRPILKEIRASVQIPCPACLGEGEAPDNHGNWKDCRQCAGTGYIGQ